MADWSNRRGVLLIIVLDYQRMFDPHLRQKPYVTVFGTTNIITFTLYKFTHILFYAGVHYATFLKLSTLTIHLRNLHNFNNSILSLVYI